MKKFISAEMAVYMALEGDRAKRLSLIDAILQPKIGWKQDKKLSLAILALELQVPPAVLREAFDESKQEDALNIIRMAAIDSGMLSPLVSMNILCDRLEVLSSNGNACAVYQLSKTIDVPTLLIQARHKRHIVSNLAKSSRLNSMKSSRENRRMEQRWRKYIPNLSVEVLDGDHYSLLRESRAAEVLRVLTEFMNLT